MVEWLRDLGNRLAAMVPANLGPAQATVRDAQLTSAVPSRRRSGLIAAIITGLIALRNH